MGKPQGLNELIDNESFQKKHSMTMPMKRVYGVRSEKLNEDEVDSRADYLVQMFGAPESKPLYCDAVRYLERSFLEEKAQYAFKYAKTTPPKLFGAIIFRQLVKAGVYPKKY